jgi:myosin heavy subunit
LLFVQVLQLCQEAGLVKLGHIALDGTKVKANASRHKAMSYSRMLKEEKRLKEEIRQLLNKAKAVDEQEDQKYGVDSRGDELPEELARHESRRKRMQDEKKALEDKDNADEQDGHEKTEKEHSKNDDKPKRGRKRKAGSEGPADNKQYNFTDPESSIMKANNRGGDQCGNAQAAVDSKKQISVAGDVNNESNDKQQFEPMIEKAQDNVGREKNIKAASDDSGYYSESNVEYGQDKEIDVYIASGKIKHNAPVAKVPRGRIPKNLTVRQKMARKLRTKKGRETYTKRKSIVEPVFGQIKRARGFIQFSLRGLEKMRGEWAIVCLTHNLLKLFKAQYAVAA